MLIEGINTNYCKGKFIVFIKVEKKRYFYGAYKSFAQAQRIAYKIAAAAISSNNGSCFSVTGCGRMRSLSVSLV